MSIKKELIRQFGADVYQYGKKNLFRVNVNTIYSYQTKIGEYRQGVWVWEIRKFSQTSTKHLNYIRAELRKRYTELRIEYRESFDNLG